jgi:hypothetical protein
MNLLLNIYYTAFFAGINFIIWAVSTGKYKINKMYIRLFALLFIITISTHIFLDGKGNYMTLKQLIVTIFFSFSILVLKSMSEKLDNNLKKESQHILEKSPSIYNRYFQISELMMGKLVFYLVFTYQVIFVWYVRYNAPF